jgi:hypothetical protein
MPAVLERVKEDKLDLLNDLIKKDICLQCYKCQVIKLKEEFVSDIRRKNGKTNLCKVCKSSNDKKYNKRNRVIFKDILIFKPFIKKCNFCLKEKNNYDFNINRCSLDGFSHKCKECLKEYNKINPRKKRSLYDKERRQVNSILKRNNILDQCIKICNNQCIYCKRTSSNQINNKTTKFYTLDHWIPLSKDGTHGIDNLILLCHSCNSSKRDKLPEEFFGEHYERINNERLRIISELNISNEIKELIENVGK